MSSESIKLHAKLYRARAIDEAISIVSEEAEGAELTRQRVGDHHVVTIGGDVGGEAGRHHLAEVGDIALVLTVDQDRR